jgi:hypothetical protein
MKDLIIGGSTNYDWSKLKYWVNSINKSGFEGDKVLIIMNCDKDTVQQVSNAGFSVIAFQQDDNGNLVYQSQLMVHVERFIHIYNTLKAQDYRYVITTDVKDVIFQKNPVEWLEQHLPDGSSEDLVFSSESIRYKDEPWGNQNLLETFGPMIHDHFKNMKNPYLNNEFIYSDFLKYPKSKLTSTEFSKYLIFDLWYSMTFKITN